MDKDEIADLIDKAVRLLRDLADSDSNADEVMRILRKIRAELDRIPG